MVNQKKVEQKLPLLLTEGLSPFEQDRNEYRLKKFKHRDPQRYNQHRNALINELQKLQIELDEMFG